MANQIANSMSADDKNSIENMDMEKMISHVTKNVFKMMNGAEGGDGNGMSGLADLFGGLNIPGNGNGNISVSESDTESESDTIYQKTRDICFDLNVDLEDFYTGKKKKLNVKRKRIVEVDGKQTIIEEKKKLIIPIEKGMKDEQQIRFEGEADQIPGYKPGDIVINLIENEHPDYQRDGDNLIIIKNINLYQIYDLSFDIKHLDSRIIKISKEPGDALHLNDSLRKVTGQGMPSYKSNGNFGDLFIRFNIVIPKTLDQDKLNILKNIFHEYTEPVNNLNILSGNVTKEYLLENVTEEDLDVLGSDDSDSDSDSSDSEDSVSESESSDSSESEDSVILPLPVLIKSRKKKL